MGRIVVGVDGSEASKRALEWAAEEARLHGASLELVFVYHPPYVSETIASPEQADEIFLRPKQDAERVLGQFAAEVRDVPVETLAVEDASPAGALVDHSRGADMLVVSARGMGAFRRLILGSVSSQLAHHAECPLVIIRGGKHG